MWDLIVSVPDHCLSFYFSECILKTNTEIHKEYAQAYVFLHIKFRQTFETYK